MRIVVALGGNALLRRGEPMTVGAQRANIRRAAGQLAPLAAEHELVITHGNGPQVGLLAQQAESGSHGGKAGGGPEGGTPLDVLGAESEGMIGYVIEQELGNVLPAEASLATILTMVEVDPDDPAFDDPTKPIGPRLGEVEARRLAEERGWRIAPDGDGWRRVVPSPEPLRIFEIRPIRWLVERGVVVVCAGGGGIPTMYEPGGRLVGADAVVDKDRASALLARELDADLLVLATDVEGVYADWGTDHERLLERIPVGDATELELPAGSMGPKVTAAVEFARATGKRAVIGSLDRIEMLVDGTTGTQFEA